MPLVQSHLHALSVNMSSVSCHHQICWEYLSITTCSPCSIDVSHALYPQKIQDCLALRMQQHYDQCAEQGAAGTAVSLTTVPWHPDALQQCSFTLSLLMCRAALPNQCQPLLVCSSPSHCMLTSPGTSCPNQQPAMVYQETCKLYKLPGLLPGSLSSPGRER